jgi:hypothetical protein
MICADLQAGANQESENPEVRLLGLSFRWPFFVALSPHMYNLANQFFGSRIRKTRIFDSLSASAVPGLNLRSPNYHESSSPFNRLLLS